MKKYILYNSYGNGAHRNEVRADKVEYGPNKIILFYKNDQLVFVTSVYTLISMEVAQ